MLLTINSEQYCTENILFSEKTKNNILTNGDFFRIYYSDQLFTTNGIFLLVNFKNIKIEKYFNKIKCIFDRNTNKKLIGLIKNIENSILRNCPIKYKVPRYRIEEQLLQGFIKIFGEYSKLQFQYENMPILLKISGVWSDDTNYGITFRFFLQPNHLLEKK